jgi:hypothetical protein
MGQAMAVQRVSDTVLYRRYFGETQVVAGPQEEAHTRAEGTLALACKHEEYGNETYGLRLVGEIAAQTPVVRAS